jgi:1-acyl-sn-glycerol-3-phosphate acyltransferase
MILNSKATSKRGVVEVIFGQKIFPSFSQNTFITFFCSLHTHQSSRMFIHILEFLYLFIWLSIIILAVLINLFVAPIIALLFGRRSVSKLFVYSANTIATIMTIEFEWKVKGKKILFFGDKLPLHQNAVIICNHLSVLDWLVLFSLARRKGRLGVTKFLTKDSVKWIPGVGWGLYLLNYVFLKRDWVKIHSSRRT